MNMVSADNVIGEMKNQLVILHQTGVARMERIRNEYISRTAHAERGQTEIMWTCPKDAEFGTARHEAKTGGSPQRGLMDVSDMKLVSFRMQKWAA